MMQTLRGRLPLVCFTTFSDYRNSGRAATNMLACATDQVMPCTLRTGPAAGVSAVKDAPPHPPPYKGVSLWKAQQPQASALGKKERFEHIRAVFLVRSHQLQQVGNR